MSSNSETLDALNSVDSVVTPISLPIRRGFNYYRNSTFFSLMIGYAGYYLCRQNLGIAFGPMQKELGLNTLQLGWISSIGTLMYAIGKFVAGPLADSKIGGRFVFLFGLFTSACFCFLFGLGHGLTFFILSWSLNRLFQSTGWSGLVNVMSQWFPRKSYGTAMGVMSMSYQFGGGLVTLYAGIILSLGGGWRSLFLVPALTLIAIGILISPFLKNRPEDVNLEPLPVESEILPELRQLPETPIRYHERLRVLFSNGAFVGMLSLSFILTFLRECFNLWMPAYFASMGDTSSGAAFKSTVFPFLGCLGTLAAGWYSDRYLSGRRSPIMAFLMALLVLSLAAIGNLSSILNFITHNASLSYLTGLTHLQVTPSTLAVPLVGVIGFLLLGSYSFVGGVVALDFGGKKVSGTAAGLLDGFGYFGATLAGVCIAQLVLQRGWSWAFFLMAGCALSGILICFLLWNVEPAQKSR